MIFLFSYYGYFFHAVAAEQFRRRRADHFAADGDGDGRRAGHGGQGADPAQSLPGRDPFLPGQHRLPDGAARDSLGREAAPDTGRQGGQRRPLPRPAGRVRRSR